MGDLELEIAWDRITPTDLPQAVPDHPGLILGRSSDRLCSDSGGLFKSAGKNTSGTMVGAADCRQSFVWKFSDARKPLSGEWKLVE